MTTIAHNIPENMTTTTGNSDGSSQNPGLLPTSSVNVNDASKAPKGAGKFAAGGDMYSSMLIGHVCLFPPS